MASNKEYKVFLNGVGIVAKSPSTNQYLGDLEVTTPDNRLHFFGASQDAVTTDNVTTTLTNKTINASNNTFSNIPNSALTNSAVTINGSSVSLGSSVTVKATATNPLTIGTGLSGTSYDGSAPVTVAIDSTVTTLTGTQTLTNKTLTAPKIATISNTGTLTLPTSTDTVVGRATTDTLTNKTIAAGSNTISGLANSNLNGSAGITNANLATMPILTIKGNNSGSSAVPQDLTASQVNTILGTLSNPMTTAGDTIYGGTSGLATRLTGNTATTKKYLTQTGDGTNSAAPSWSSLQAPYLTNYSVGTYTHTFQTNCYYVEVIVVGGGGGGSSGFPGSAGSSGTYSSFDNLVANPGAGGPYGSGATGGAGGTATKSGLWGSLLPIQGGYGQGICNNSGGCGGSNPLGGAGGGATQGANRGAGGRNYCGAGGGGGGSASSFGGMGGGAGGYHHGFMNDPITNIGTTASVVVGSGGASGSNASGTGGGTGSDGFVVVREWLY
jgi:hypothetical protein